MRKTIGEVLVALKSSSSDEDKVAILKSNNHQYLRQFLKYCMDPTIEFALPEGIPDYKQMNFRVGFSSSDLFNEMKRMYLFVKPHKTEKYHPGLSKETTHNQLKREQIFISMLESFDVVEQGFFIDMKEKTLDVVSAEVVNKVFPGLIPEGELPRKSLGEVAKEENDAESKQVYTNLGKCKTCKTNEAEIAVRHGQYMITCLSCGIHTDGSDTSKSEAIKSWRAIPAPAKVKKGKILKPPPAGASLIIPTKSEAKEFIDEHDQGSFLEDVEEDLSGIEPADTPFDLEESADEFDLSIKEELIIIPNSKSSSKNKNSKKPLIISGR